MIWNSKRESRTGYYAGNIPGTFLGYLPGFCRQFPGILHTWRSPNHKTWSRFWRICQVSRSITQRMLLQGTPANPATLWYTSTISILSCRTYRRHRKSLLLNQYRSTRKRLSKISMVRWHHLQNTINRQVPIYSSSIGLNSSPFVLNRTLKKHTEKFADDEDFVIKTRGCQWSSMSMISLGEMMTS